MHIAIESRCLQEGTECICICIRASLVAGNQTATALVQDGNNKQTRMCIQNFYPYGDAIFDVLISNFTRIYMKHNHGRTPGEGKATVKFFFREEQNKSIFSNT